MTDLERTGAELSQERFLLECAEAERRDWEQTYIAAWLTRILAAARREGAEEMRERAAVWCDNEVPWLGLGEDIRALPLTPEEPP